MCFPWTFMDKWRNIGAIMIISNKPCSRKLQTWIKYMSLSLLTKSKCVVGREYFLYKWENRYQPNVKGSLFHLINLMTIKSVPWISNHETSFVVQAFPHQPEQFGRPPRGFGNRGDTILNFMRTRGIFLNILREKE